MELVDLKQPVSYKWKVQSYNADKTKGSCVAYIDARDVMDILDKVCGPEMWQDKYEFVGDKLIAGIGIFNKELYEWVWKYDTGTESQTEAEKGLFSDAFKRASVKWGIGRFLYDLDIKWIKIKDKRPVDDNGNVIWDLTKHFNSQITPPQPVKQTGTDEVVTEPIKTLIVYCETCHEPMILKEGISYKKDPKGIPYSFYKCSKDESHPLRNV